MPQAEVFSPKGEKGRRDRASRDALWGVPNRSLIRPPFLLT